MKRRLATVFVIVFCAFAVLFFAGESFAQSTHTIRVSDSIGREIQISVPAERVICSGSGCLRLLVYLQGQNRVVAVEDNEKKGNFGPRPYALANPWLKDLPLMGEFRGNANPELILGVQPLPQVIFKTYPESGIPVHVLEEKTGIPVIGLGYGNLAHGREMLYSSLRLMGKVIGHEERGESVISFFEEHIADLQKRTQGIAPQERKTCYVGGIASRGPHGFSSTELAYPPFVFTGAVHVAAPKNGQEEKNTHADGSKEKLLEWDPDVIFVDLSTLNADDRTNAFSQLKNDPIYQELSAVKNGEIYGVLPYNWYTQNFGSILADAYFVGKILYPDRFLDVDPAQKADEIYQFLVGKNVFQEMNDQFQDLAFTKISLK